MKRDIELLKAALKESSVIIHNTGVDLRAEPVFETGGVVVNARKMLIQMIEDLARVFGRTITKKEATCVLNKARANKKQAFVHLYYNRTNPFLDVTGVAGYVGWSAVKMFYDIWEAEFRAGIAKNIYIQRVEKREDKEDGYQYYFDRYAQLEDDLFRFMEVLLIYTS